MMKIFSLSFRSHFKRYTKIDGRFFYDNSVQKHQGSVNEETIIDCLKTSSVRFKVGYTCFCVSKCFSSPNKNCKTGGEVFINKKTGFSMCVRCNVGVKWDVYCDLLNKTKQKIDEEYFDKNSCNFPEWDDVVKKTENLEFLSDPALCGVLESFKLKPFSRSVIEKLNIRISAEKDVLYFPLYMSDFVVGYKTYHRNGEENTFPKVNCPGVLKPLKHSNSDAAVVVGSIQDFLAISSVNLRGYEVICLPYGALHLPQSSLPLLEKYKKIILWFGEKYIDLTGQIAEKLHKKRCYVVECTKDQISASVAFSKKVNISKIISEAKLCYHECVTTFSSFRDAILHEVQNPKQVIGIPWQKFPTLNKILKGHRRGELTLLTGPTGVGKTTFLSEYSLDLASQGVHTLWGSFEIKNIKLAKIMLTQFAEAPLPPSTPELNALCNKFEKLPIFFLTFHGQQPILSVMDAINHCSYVYDIAHVIIDNVQFMIEVCPDSYQMDRFHRQDYMIQLFRSFASQRNCHVTLVMHPKKTESSDLAINSIFGGAKASQEADNILIIQKSDVFGSGTNKYLEVIKNRFSGDLGSFPLYFCKESLSFIEKKAVDTYSKPDAGDDDEESYEYIQRKKYDNFGMTSAK